MGNEFELRVQEEVAAQDHNNDEKSDSNSVEVEQKKSLRMVAGRQQKKRKVAHLTPILQAYLSMARRGKPKPQWVTCLLDSGSGATLKSRECAKRLKLKTRKAKKSFRTAGGVTTATELVQTEFRLPELSQMMLIDFDMYVMDNLCSYDVIIGRDLMAKLGISLDFTMEEVQWKELSVPFKDKQKNPNELYMVTKELKSEIDHMTSVVDATYAKADLNEVCAECENLDDKEQAKLFEMLSQHETLFDGTLGIWKGHPYDILIYEEDPQPYHTRSYPILKIHEAAFKKELE